MKLLVFTPVVRASAIGRVTRLVTRALVADGHEVTIVRTELDQSPEIHPFDVATISWNDQVAVRAAALAADVCVFQIGDNYLFHAGSVRWMPEFPGIVCLHDYFVGNLFAGWIGHHGYDPDPTTRAWYGDEVADRLKGRFTTADLDERAAIAPMTEWIVSQAIGVLTHGTWVLDHVARACPGPIRFAPLPYDVTRVPVDPALPTRAGRVRLLTVGHINPNKRVASVIRAIAASPSLRERVTYTLVGPIVDDQAARLRQLAESLRVDLVIEGPATDAGLARAFADAHVVTALRWPCLEVASASAIEAMLLGKPTLVTRTGFYEEIPDDCVVKIELDDEVEQIRAALESLIDDPARRAALGGRAKAYAIAHHRADRYATELVALATDALLVAPVLDVVRAVVGALNDWGVDDVGDEFTFGPLRELWGGDGTARTPRSTV